MINPAKYFMTFSHCFKGDTLRKEMETNCAIVLVTSVGETKACIKHYTKDGTKTEQAVHCNRANGNKISSRAGHKEHMEARQPNPVLC